MSIPCCCVLLKFYILLSFQYDFNHFSCMLMTSFHVSVPNWPFLPPAPTQGSMGLKDSIIPRIPRQHSYGQIPLPPHLSFLTLDSPIPSPTGSPGFFFPSDSGSDRPKTSRETSPPPCSMVGLLSLVSSAVNLLTIKPLHVNCLVWFGMVFL